MTPPSVSSYQSTRLCAFLAIESTMDNIGTTLPMKQLATDSVGVEDVSTLSITEKLTPEHGCMEDIGNQKINFESIPQETRSQTLEMESSGTDVSANELEPVFPKLDGLQNSLPETVAAHSRSLIRDLSILHLPDELLREIFRLVRGGFGGTPDYHDTTYDIRTVMHAQFTCWRFYNTSSHLLLHQIDISLTPSSLARLDEISRHETISKGVRSLRIYAGIYNPSVAGSPQAFTAEVAQNLRNNLITGSALASSSSRPDTSQQDLAAENAAIAANEGVIASCTEFLQAGTPEQDDDQDMAAVLRVYEEYRQLVADQGTLLRDEAFVRRVAAAAARMPTITGLFITDRKGLNDSAPAGGLSDPIYHLVRGTTLVPSRWADAGLEQLEQRPVDLLYQLPLALHRAGTSLTGFRIDVTPVNGFTVSPDGAQVSGLLQAAKQLQELRYKFDGMFNMRPAEGWEEFSGFLAPFQRAKRLQSVAFNFGGFRIARHVGEPDPASVGALLAKLPWKGLRRVSLSSFPIQFDELASCLEQLEPGAYIALSDVDLTSGTWADLLDVLRARGNEDSIVECPRGGEEWDWGPEWDEGLFGIGDPAVQYIRGYSIENPLRSPPG